MIRHVVLIKFLPGATAGACKEAIAALRALPSLIPEILAWSIGEQARVATKACDVAEVSVFRSFEALDAFRAHPAHVKVRDMLAAIAVWHVVDYVYDPKEDMLHD